MPKKAQVTIFVVLGIVVLIFILLILFIVKEKLSSNKILDESYREDSNYEILFYNVNLCADLAVKESLRDFKIPSNNSLFIPNLPSLNAIPIVVDDNYDLFPTLDVIEKNFSKQVVQKHKNCLNNSNLTESIRINGSIRIHQDSIVYNYSVNIDSKYLVENYSDFTNKEFKHVESSKLGERLEILRNFSHLQSQENDMFNLGAIAQIAFEQNIDYSFFVRNKAVIINFDFNETGDEWDAWFSVR